ncbi:unnamed protein product [Closterium sp. NIES-65]|nr:unnamed protein product [Closterium sp. NIES-65]
MSHGLCACLLPLSVRPHSQALPPAPNLCGLRPLTPPTALRRRDLGGLGGDSPNLPFAGEESGGAGLLAARGAFLRGRVARRGPAPARSLGARGSGGVHGGMRRRKRRVWTRRGEEEEAEKGRGGGGSDTDANDLGGVYLRRGVGRGKEGGEREKGKGERERGEVVEGKRGGMGGAGGGRDGKESEKERSDSKEEGARVSRNGLAGSKGTANPRGERRNGMAGGGNQRERVREGVEGLEISEAVGMRGEGRGTRGVRGATGATVTTDARGTGEEAEGVRGGAGRSVEGGAGEVVGAVAGTVVEAVMGVTGTVKDVTESVTESVLDTVTDMTETVKDVKDSVEETIKAYLQTSVAASAASALEDESFFAGPAMAMARGMGSAVEPAGAAAAAAAAEAGLEPALAPASPYALVVANVNALVAQLLFVFLSGAVFARLTHPVDPILCSKIACITPPLQQPQQQQQGVNVLGGAAGGSGQSPPVRYPPAAHSLSRSISSANFGGSAAFAASSSFPAAAGTAVAGGGGAEGGGFGTGGGGMGGGRGCERMLLVRYVLAGPQPCELVDVKVELTLKHNTLSCTGRFFRQVDHLKLVRSEDSYQRYGMTVRHLIDESSPLYGRSRDDLCLVNAQLSLAVIGMERASMQPVFHVEDYFVADEDVIWNADFEDMVYRDDKNRLLVDHRKISNWVGIEL